MIGPPPRHDHGTTLLRLGPAARHDHGTPSRATIMGPPPPESGAPSGAPSAPRPRFPRARRAERVKGVVRERAWSLGVGAGRLAEAGASALAARETSDTAPLTRSAPAGPASGGEGYAAGSTGFSRFRYDSPSITRS